MNGNVASSPIKNNFLPIIDRWSAVISSPAVYKLDKKEHIVHTQIQDMHDRTQSICSIILHHRHAHRTQSIGNTTYKKKTQYVTNIRDTKWDIHY
jgi:hypothetical protein